MALTITEMKQMITESIPAEQGIETAEPFDPKYVHMNKANYDVARPEITRILDDEIFAGLIVKITPDLPDNKIIVTQ